MKILVASQNNHKIKEIRSFLGKGFEFVSMGEMGFMDDIPETGTTLSDNSRLKAEYLAQKTSLPVLADDSGLEVEALNGAPGVYSARYAGQPKSDEKNTELLLKNLQGIENRNARFITVLTLLLDGKYVQFEGEVKGQIISEKRGEQGFGYDPVFLPDGFTKTFAQMNMDEKNEIAHRARALKKLSDYLKI